MKKLISLALVMMLCLTSVVAMAASVPSKTTENLTVVVAGADGVKLAVNPIGDSKAQAVCAAEIEKLAAAKSVADYFGASVDLVAMLGTSELNVHEMGSIDLSGYDAAMGELPVTFTWPTAYAAGEKVAVMIGIVGPDGAIEWTALEGVSNGSEGISAVIPAELAQAIQNGTALVAIVSK